MYFIAEELSKKKLVVNLWIVLTRTWIKKKKNAFQSAPKVLIFTLSVLNCISKLSLLLFLIKQQILQVVENLRFLQILNRSDISFKVRFYEAYD